MKIKGILIDPRIQSVTAIEMENDHNNHKRIAALLECQLFDRARLSDHDLVWIDDEGLLVQPNPNGYFQLPVTGWGNYVFAGLGLILGATDGGYDTDAALTVEQVAAMVRFPTFEQLGAETLEPKHTIVTWDKDGARHEQDYPCPVIKRDAT